MFTMENIMISSMKSFDATYIRIQVNICTNEKKSSLF